jgi:hypothetical protein
MFVFYHSMTEREFEKSIIGNKHNSYTFSLILIFIYIAIQFWSTLLTENGVILLDFYKNKLNGKIEKFDYNLGWMCYCWCCCCF